MLFINIRCRVSRVKVFKNLLFSLLSYPKNRMLRVNFSIQNKKGATVLTETPF